MAMLMVVVTVVVVVVRRELDVLTCRHRAESSMMMMMMMLMRMRMTRCGGRSPFRTVGVAYVGESREGIGLPGRGARREREASRETRRNAPHFSSHTTTFLGSPLT